jgi:hypothetical protein
MHASVNMHVSTHYQDLKGNDTYPNHNLYYKNIGAFPYRVKNMYFLYAAILRAVNRAEPILRSYEYDTNLDREEDMETHTLANKLLDITITNCETPFEES